MTMVTFVDETTAGDRATAWHLEIFEERLTLREVIRRRVFQEVSEHNATTPLMFRGLVQPTDTESSVNGYRTREPRRVDAEEQFRRAVEAFSRNGFVVIVGDRQIEELDADIDLRAGLEITFLKLIALVGG